MTWSTNGRQTKRFPGWEPWTQAKWDAWLEKSKRLVEELAKLDAAGKREERNALIDAHSVHWAELKPWLLKLSAGKCWFSEARELYSHYDVEHFRPKKEARDLKGARPRDGYWWLAFNYTNFRVCGTVGNRKKGGWFPLLPGSPCSTYSDQCEEAETPYLLDPIDAHDVNLLAFDEEGKATPAPDTSDWESQRVNETIKRLKLNEHEPLSEARRKVWQEAHQLIEEYKRFKARCNKGYNPVASEKMKQACIKLRKMMQSTAELSSVAKWCVLLRNDNQLARLIG